jgi:hypothetical protein
MDPKGKQGKHGSLVELIASEKRREEKRREWKGREGKGTGGTGRE